MMEIKIIICPVEDSIRIQTVEKLRNEGWEYDPKVNRGSPLALEAAVVYHLVKYTPEEIKASQDALLEVATPPIDSDVVVNIIEIKLDDKPETVGKFTDDGKGQWRVAKDRYSGKVQLEMVKKLSEINPDLFKKTDDKKDPQYLHNERVCEQCGAVGFIPSIGQLEDKSWICQACSSKLTGEKPN